MSQISMSLAINQVILDRLKLNCMVPRSYCSTENTNARTRKAKSRNGSHTAERNNRQQNTEPIDLCAPIVPVVRKIVKLKIFHGI